MVDVDPILVQLVLDAIPGTLAAISAAHPGERITGYALGTDDDVCGVFHVALTAERTTPRDAFSFNGGPRTGPRLAVSPPVRRHHAT